MKHSIPLALVFFTLLPGLGAAGEVTAQTPTEAHAQGHAAAHASSLDVSPDATPATVVLDHFSAALKKGDMDTVKAILDPGVLILESGYAERSRDEYLGHHAASDAEFLGPAEIVVIRRSARRSGDLAWVGTESEIRTRKDDKPLTLISTETVVLKRVGEDWHIVHIHWSSHPKA
jgi:ketosteroid isomerase-like protein